MTAVAPRPATGVLRQSTAPRYAFAPFEALEDLRDETETALVATRAEAFAAGVAHAAADARAEADALRAEADRLAERLVEAETALGDLCSLADATADRLAGTFAGAVRALEPTLAAFAVAVAEGVLDAPLTDAQQHAATAALADAVDALAGDTPTTVALHPVDLLRLQENGLADALSATHAALRWEPDTHLAPGDWTVETPDAAVHRLRAPMLGALRSRLGLPDDAVSGEQPGAETPSPPNSPTARP